MVRKVRRQFERVAGGLPEEPPNTGLAMRWLWLDRFTEFERGKRSVAIKNVCLSEEPLSEYLPGFPILPNSLIVEGLAWTGGILVQDDRGFRERVVLAKVNKAIFHRPAVAGDQLTYTAELEANEAEGAFIRGTSHIGGELQAEVELFLAHLPESFQEVQGDLIDPAEMLAMLRLFGVYDVGRIATGAPLDIPDKLQEAERLSEAEGR
jgi:3-hydroxyacyl-[acyl-carrier-protein] dehydratase